MPMFDSWTKEEMEEAKKPGGFFDRMNACENAEYKLRDLLDKSHIEVDPDIEELKQVKTLISTLKDNGRLGHLARLFNEIYKFQLYKPHLNLLKALLLYTKQYNKYYFFFETFAGGNGGNNWYKLRDHLMDEIISQNKMKDAYILMENIRSESINKMI